VSAATDVRREALEALDIDAAESEVDELRNALDAARTALKDAATEVRTAIKAANEAIELALKRCEPDAENVHDESAIVEAIEALGGAHSGMSGPLDDLDSTADTLDSAADDVTSALGDEPAQAQRGPLAGICGHAYLDDTPCAPATTARLRVQAVPHERPQPASSITVRTEADGCSWVVCRCGFSGPGKHSYALALMAWVVKLSSDHPRQRVQGTQRPSRHCLRPRRLRSFSRSLSGRSTLGWLEPGRDS
jgi:hypothetical protein